MTSGCINAPRNARFSLAEYARGDKIFNSDVIVHASLRLEPPVEETRQEKSERIAKGVVGAI